MVLFLWHMVAIFVVAVLWWCFFAGDPGINHQLVDFTSTADVMLLS